METQSLREAAIITGMIAVGAAVADIWLLRTDRAPITAVLRTRVGRASMLILGLHVVDVLGVLDPFSAAGKRITGGTRRLPGL